ncbi:MAG: hypothetical protein ACFFCS_16750, partial [Candidatus Hodarchaeota archaeon]
MSDESHSHEENQSKSNGELDQLADEFERDLKSHEGEKRRRLALCCIVACVVILILVIVNSIWPFI